MKEPKMKLVIVIEGDSADELFAVGPLDLKNHFLPEGLRIKSADVKKCWFEKVDREKMLTGEAYEVVKHKDNIY